MHFDVIGSGKGACLACLLLRALFLLLPVYCMLATLEAHHIAFGPPWLVVRPRGFGLGEGEGGP